MPVSEDVRALERVLLSFPVKVCAECRMVYDADAETEWHLSGCAYLISGRLTEVIGYRSLFEAQAAGVVYTPPLLQLVENQGAA